VASATGHAVLLDIQQPPDHKHELFIAVMAVYPSRVIVCSGLPQSSALLVLVGLRLLDGVFQDVLDPDLHGS
jgi:hypothetical protein